MLPITRVQASSRTFGKPCWLQMSKSERSSARAGCVSRLAAATAARIVARIAVPRGGPDLPYQVRRAFFARPLGCRGVLLGFIRAERFQQLPDLTRERGVEAGRLAQVCDGVL